MKDSHNNMNTIVESGAARANGLIRLAILATFFMASLSTSAQDVIITVTKMRQNLPMSLTEFIDHPNRYITVTLQNNTRRAQKVYLKFSLTTDYSLNGTPLEIHTQDRGQTRPYITLAPYQTRRMSRISDFQDHFGAGRLSTNATMDILSLTRIPEGDYECCMEVYQWQETVVNDGEPLSSSCASYNVCYSGSAPEIISPVSFNDGDIDNNIITPSRTITFRWTGVTTNCPNSSRFNYTLKIVRVREGLTPEYAISHAPVVFSRLCKNTTYCQLDTLRNLEMPFERGAVYAAQVEAHDANATSLNGGMILGNDGKSQVVCFSWGTPAYNINFDNNAHVNRYLQETQNTQTSTSSQNDVLAALRHPYICYPYRDATTYAAVLAAFPDELSKIPDEDRDAQVKYNGNYDDHIVNTKKSPFDIKWMPVRGNGITHVRYTVDLFDDIGTLSDIDSRTPLAIKVIDYTPTAEDQLFNGDNPLSVADTSWEKVLLPGRKYVARVVAQTDYNYNDYKIDKIVHYVNGIEADTEYDTVKTVSGGTESFSSILLFQWGLVGEQVPSTPPQNAVKQEEKE